MENGMGPGTPSPLSPKVDNEQQEEEEAKVVVNDKMEDISDAESDIVEIIRLPIAPPPLQQVNGGASPSAPSANVVTDNQEEAEEAVPVEAEVNDQQQQEIVQVRRPPRVDDEIIDLTGDDDEDDLDMNETDSTCAMDDDSFFPPVPFSLPNWDDMDYPLWKYSPEFKQRAQPFLSIAERFGETSLDICYETYKRDPTVADFAQCCVNEGVPDRNWYGTLMVANTERRGWPLQYASVGKVFIEETGSERRLDRSRVQWKYVVDDKLVEPDGPSAKELKLWQVELTEIGEGEREFYDVEAAKNILGIVRKLMYCVWFPSDPDLFKTFFEHCLYDRLALLFYLEFPSPTSGILSYMDRGNIVSAIKHYNHLKNCAFKVYPSSKKAEDEVNMEEGGDGDKVEAGLDLDRSAADDAEMKEDDAEDDRTTVKFEMDMKRHTLEMSFLLSPGLRPLLPFISSTDEGDQVNPDEVVLVMKETNVRSLKFVYEEMEKYGVKEDANIRIVPDLEVALKKCIGGTTVFVSTGNYNISGLWKLSDGGSVIGLKTASEDVTISPSDAIGEVWMLLDGSVDATLHLKNLSLVVDSSVDNQLKTMIHVTKGNLNMIDCVLRDNKPAVNDVQVGSIVKSDGAVVNVDEACVFTNVLDLSVS